MPAASECAPGGQSARPTFHAHDPCEAEFWPIRLREPLPTISVPLKPGDPDARLDLQALLHRVYDAGAYAADIHTGHPEPPLSPEDAAWAQSLLGLPAES